MRPGWLLDWRRAPHTRGMAVEGYETAYGVEHKVALINLQPERATVLEGWWRWTIGLSSAAWVPLVTAGYCRTAEAARIAVETAWARHRQECRRRGCLPYAEGAAYGYLDRETGTWVPQAELARRPSAMLAEPAPTA